MKGQFHPIEHILRLNSLDKLPKKKIELCMELEAVENSNKLPKNLRSTVLWHIKVLCKNKKSLMIGARAARGCQVILTFKGHLFSGDNSFELNFEL